MMAPANLFLVQRGYRWVNDNINSSDVYLCCGLSLLTDEAKIKGQFFDTLFVADAFSLDATDTFNSHTWQNITNNYLGGQANEGGYIIRGGFWITTS